MRHGAHWANRPWIRQSARRQPTHNASSVEFAAATPPMPGRDGRAHSGGRQRCLRPLAPGLQISDRSLQLFHFVVTLVADLGQPDQLEVTHPLL